MSKEWKGNSASWRSQLGINKHFTTDERESGDYYTTDPTAVQALLDKLGYRLTDGVVWECACGCGNISEVLFANGYDVISTDLHYSGYGESGCDFLQTKQVIDPKCDVIITNPPYSLANEFILHAMDILPNGGEYFALMNLSYLTGNKRYTDIYSKRYLYAVYIYSYRINCYKNNIDTGKSSPVNYAWFHFIKGNTLSRPKIYWITK